MQQILDLLVPFGPFLRRTENQKPFLHWQDLLLHIIPLTFFIYWIFSLIPVIGTILYMIILVPLSAHQHLTSKKITNKKDKHSIYLWYFVVISIGFGGLWSFIGHTFLADFVASQIGWAIGSPFQTELAFYTLGSATAALLSVWLRGHMITALVISKSIFLYGASFVHIQEAILHNNYSPLNIGAPLIGDIILPTIMLTLLFKVLKKEFAKN
jgi:hypothetical protein